MATWMVVEDEPDLYDLVLSMYETLGLEGIAFADGEQAVSWIESVDNGQVHSDLPELALVDIRLPNQIGGAEVGARLRQSPRLGNMVIVLMTAYRLSRPDEKAILEQAKADLLLYKPLPALNEFYSLMQNALQRR